MKTGDNDRNSKRKILRLLCFVLSGLLVMTVSASVYYSLSMQPSVTIMPSVVVFKEGNDWDAAWSPIGTNNTWCSLALKAYPNATLTYEQPLNLNNTGTAVDIRLTSVSISPDSGDPSVSNFAFINFTLHDGTGAIMGSLNYTTSGNDWSTSSTGYVTMNAGDEWYITVQTKATAGAQADVVVNIVIAVDVQE